MTSQPGLQKFAIHVLHNTSQSKGNQTMKLETINRISQDKIFSPNIMWKMRQGE